MRARAFEVHPEFLDSYWREVQPFVAEGDFIEAIPEDPYLYVRFAELCNDDAVGRLLLARAEELFLASEPAPQDVAKHHYNLGRIAEIKREYQAAEAHYGQAVQSDPSATDWRYRYVLTLERNGRRNLAREQIDRCLTQDRDHPIYLKKQQELKGR